MIWAFAIKGKRRRLQWAMVDAPSDGAAIKAFRDSIGPDLEIYAGPLPQRCQMNSCDEQATTKIGKPPWLAVCQNHDTGVMPYHTNYMRK